MATDEDDPSLEVLALRLLIRAFVRYNSSSLFSIPRALVSELISKINFSTIVSCNVVRAHSSISSNSFVDISEIAITLLQVLEYVSLNVNNQHRSSDTTCWGL
ncbi:hypothetical protein L6452_31252 [Arctium lappa]|uniref:Uncharacterized protein n=1 Tax=Arctium lappa TaxID=4217 RepID=A0ACB8ZPT3_ARCLA|nr:hypothetical protein L6452_31252 [Arctium lappa]